MDIQLLDASHCCENYTKLYFDVKHLEKRLNRVSEVFGALFPIKSAFFGQ